MHISNLTLTHFKSFKSDTQLTNFSKNVNLIVGRNGTGKSNIIHAFTKIFDTQKMNIDEKIHLISDGNLISTQTSIISLGITNNDRFVVKENDFSIKRMFCLRNDEYFLVTKENNQNVTQNTKNCNNVDEKENFPEDRIKMVNHDKLKAETSNNEVKISRDEITGLFDSVNLNINTHFIVQQGKINAIAVLSDKERLDLIKEIAGASTYEKDRKESCDLLLESEKNEERAVFVLKNIEERLKSLEKERKDVILYEKLEKEKHVIEIAILEIERDEVDEKIREFEDESGDSNSFFYDDDDSDDEDKRKINRIENEILTLEKGIKESNTDFFDFANENIDINNSLVNKIDSLKLSPENNEKDIKKRLILLKNEINLVESKLIEKKSRLKSLKKEEKTSLKEKNVTKMEIDNYKVHINKIGTINYEKEIEETSKTLKKKKEEYSAYLNSKGIQKNKNNLNDESFIDTLPLKSLEQLIEERNKTWREEKKANQKRKGLLDDYIFIERKLLAKGGLNSNTYKTIKNCKGVHGLVYELLNIPEELIKALEVVAGSSLFNVVVDNEDIATELINKIEGRATFIPLNRINSDKNANLCEIDLDDAIPLSSQIKCDQIYKPFLNYITKNAYLVSDVKTGIDTSKMYNLNVVTLDGDFISKTGSISGGYLKNNDRLAELKKKTDEIRQIEIKRDEIKLKLKKIEEDMEKIRNKDIVKINESNLIGHDESIKEIITFLERKLGMLVKESKDHKKSVNFENLTKKQMMEYENTKRVVELKCIKLKNVISECEYEIEENEVLLKNKIKEIEDLERKINVIEDLEKYSTLKNELKFLKEKEDFKKQKEYENDLNSGINSQNNELQEKEKKKINKRILMEKRGEIMKKIGNIEIDREEFKHYFDPNTNMEELYVKLKSINEKLRKYTNINRRANTQFDEQLDQKEKLFQRMDELKAGRKKILEFIDELDEKKNEAIELTVSMLQTHFKYFYKKLSLGNSGELVHTENGIEILENGKEYNNLKNLSGGQKTLLALSLIFSIQKIDPAPFYFFDEIDANLDREGRIRVCEVIKEISSVNGRNTQFFIATFREEMIEAGDKFFGVTYCDKNSSVREISKEEAKGFLSDDYK